MKLHLCHCDMGEVYEVKLPEARIQLIKKADNNHDNQLDSRLPTTRGGIPLLSIRIHVLVNINIIAFKVKVL